MRKLLKKIEAAFAAAAFAEEGDAETARRIVAEAGTDDPAPSLARGAAATGRPAGRRGFQPWRKARRVP